MAGRKFNFILCKHKIIYLCSCIDVVWPTIKIMKSDC